jgi:hypothetical protein
MGALLALTAIAPPPAASNPLPTVPANPAANPYLQVGMDAIASGLRTVTVTVDIGNESTLAQRINQTHFGMSLTGWIFVAQEVVTPQSGSSILLLTYRR